MKCPKCQYISFESSERCRNCGYEFSLAVDSAGFDLPIHTGDEAIGPLNDFALEPRAGSASGAPAADRAASLAEFGPTPPARPITSSFDLPLFKERRRDSDAPLVAPPVVPRAPLAVRRSAPTPAPRAPHRPADEPVLDLEPPLAVPRIPPLKSDPAPSIDRGLSDDEIDSTVAAPGSRFLAAGLDGLILASIGLIVLYLTLKVCGLQFAAASGIPPVPFAAFLLLIAGGYLTLFTAAGGQTIGKMATGIRVVPADVEQLRVPLGHSVLRAAASLVSALPAGLGFLPALLGSDRRALHDRLADTRVVKA